MEKTRIEKRVRFGDTDPFGVLYFAALLAYFKESVDEFIRGRGEKPEEIYRNRGEGFGFPVVRVEADYLKPVPYDEVIVIECSLGAVGNRSVTFAIAAYSGGEIVSRGKVTFAAISDDWKSISLPPRIVNLVKSRE